MNMIDDSSPMGRLASSYKRLFDTYLDEFLRTPRPDIPERLMSAISYSLQAGGKRLRPCLCLAAAERCGLAPERALPMAFALEMMHTASLIHDDLPCMDDDALRRGRPSNHMVFGEALSLIAADAMIIWAPGYALKGSIENNIPASWAIAGVNALIEGSGPEGMCGGQVLDVDPESRSEESGFVYQIAAKKTAALMRAAIVSGAAVAGAGPDVLIRYANYGWHLGIAFQIVDDILDETSTEAELGKTPGKDSALAKMTFVSEYGVSRAYELARDESESAADSIEPLFDGGDLLIDIARTLVGRKR